MRRISINPRFINEAGNDLIPGKIHTIRQNYEYWKRFEGQELALFVWEGKPYRSKQKVFCVKKLCYVQNIGYAKTNGIQQFYIPENSFDILYCAKNLANNDGFENAESLFSWFADYKDNNLMAILHFTDFRY